MRTKRGETMSTPINPLADNVVAVAEEASNKTARNNNQNLHLDV